MKRIIKSYFRLSIASPSPVARCGHYRGHSKGILATRTSLEHDDIMIQICSIQKTLKVVGIIFIFTFVPYELTMWTLQLTVGSNSWWRIVPLGKSLTVSIFKKCHLVMPVVTVKSVRNEMKDFESRPPSQNMEMLWILIGFVSSMSNRWNRVNNVCEHKT